MIRFLEPMLYIDDQAQVPVCLCEKMRRRMLRAGRRLPLL